MKKHEKFKKHEKYARHKMLQVKLSSCEVSVYDHMTLGAENKFKEKPFLISPVTNLLYPNIRQLDLNNNFRRGWCNATFSDSLFSLFVFFL